MAHKLAEKLLAFPATTHILGLPLENHHHHHPHFRSAIENITITTHILGLVNENYNHHQFTTEILGVTLENVHLVHVAGCWLVVIYEL